MQQDNKEKEVQQPKKKKNYVKKILKGILYIVLGLFALNLLLVLLLSIPAVQQKVLGFAVGKIKEIVKTEVRIDRMRLNIFPRVSLGLEGVYVEDLAQDTLLYANDLEAGIRPWRLINSELIITSVNAEDFTVKISQKNPDADFNFQFLLDAFSGDTAVADTTAGTLMISIHDVNLKNGRVKYDILSDTLTPGEFNTSHIEIRNLNANLDLPSIDTENLDVSLVSMNFFETSGLIVNNLKGDITSDGSTFHLKNTELTLPNSGLNIPSAQYDTSTEEFELTADRSEISPGDLLPVMKELRFLRNNIVLETSMKGKLPAVNVDTITVNYGQETQLRGKASISSYEDYGNADLLINIANLQITPEDINDFAKVGDSTFVAPDMLATLGVIRLEALAAGSLKDINIDAEARVRQGALQLVGKASTDTTFENYSANLKLQTQNFNLGSLLAMPELGRLSANMNVLASQTSARPLSADAQGTVYRIQYENRNYDNIPFTAYYNSAQMGVWLKADLPEGKLEAKVDMTNSNNPRIDMDVDVEKLQLNNFVELPDWKDPELSLHLKGNITGLDLSRIQADMVIDDLIFSHDSISFIPGTIALQAGIRQDSVAQNYIHLSSSLLDANLVGEYNFMTLPNEVMNIMNAYLPGFFTHTNLRRPAQNNFNFTLNVQNTEELGRVFGLAWNVIDPLSFTGSINTPADDLRLNAHLPYVEYNDIAIRNTDLDVATTDSLMSLRGATIFDMETMIFDFNLDGSVVSDTIYANLTAKRDSADMHVDINLDAKAHVGYSSTGQLVSSVQFSPTFWEIGKLNMTFMPAFITNEGNTTSISNFGFMVGRGRVLNKYFGVDGVISDQPQDTLNVSFDHANLGYILQAFDINNISTIADGDIKVNNIMNQPEIYTDNFRLADIILFSDTLGTLNLTSRWSNSAAAARVNAILTNPNENTTSTIAGLVYPTRDSLDLNVNIDRLSLNWIQPFMAEALNHVSGSISSQLAVQGRLSAPAVNGWLGVNNASLGIDFTNVTYNISDTIQITPERIGFENLIVTDPENNRAIVNALVTHQDFENLKFNLDMNFTNFMLLNTAARTDSLFYGKMYASGKANIEGDMEDIRMNVDVRNARQSRINVLIPQTSDANVYQSVVFINTPDEGVNIPEPEEERPSTLPLNLTANINVSPDLVVGIVINPETGDRMEVRGTGLINFTYDMESEAMNAFGDYEISQGFVRLRLQNLVNMEFKIQQGSKLILNGDPMATNFDITAYRSVRADLRTLSASFDDGQTSPFVNANLILGITGNMDQMQLTYDINLPDASDDVQQRVRSLIATDDQKIRQFAYLLVAGTFLPEGQVNAAPGGNIANSVLTSVASSALSAGLNSVLGNVIGSGWQIGTNFQTDDGTFDNMDMTVSLSKSFLDDRLEFNTNLGYRTDQTNDDSFIGDFDVTYALTRSIKLKVFNKTNDRYYKQADMTQGIGIVYTREAKTLKQLFNFFRRPRPNRQQQAQTGGTR